MNRITISVTPEIEQAMRREARRQGCSVSAVARDAIGAHLHLVVSADSPRRKLGFVGIGEGGGESWAERAEEVLDRDWGDQNFDRDS
jgi:hypothetical protein